MKLGARLGAATGSFLATRFSHRRSVGGVGVEKKRKKASARLRVKLIEFHRGTCLFSAAFFLFGIAMTNKQFIRLIRAI